MKHVAIITMHRVMNVGSILQAYALQQAVCKLGYECDIVDYRYPSVYHVMRATGVENPNAGRGLLRTAMKWLGLFRLVKGFRFWFEERGSRDLIVRQSSFLKCTSRVYTRKTIAKGLPPYDIYLTGSDQVWNSRYIHDDLNFFWSFTADDAVRVSYASSFGASAVPLGYQNIYGKQLQRFRAISVRERSGVPITRAISGREAMCVLDPTFLLRENDWRCFADGALPNEASRPYVFFYLLDYVFDPCPAAYELARRISRELGIRVIISFGGGGGDMPPCREDVMSITRFIWPREFIALVRGARAVVSNSFHGVALSANFHKDFLAILNPNKSQDDRVRDFLARVGLEARGVELSALNSQSAPYWDVADFSRLEALRAQSRDWLTCALTKT